MGKPGKRFTPGAPPPGEGNHLPRILLEQMRNAVVATDLEGVVTLWNPHAEAISGWRADEAIGRSIDDLLIPAAYRGRAQLVGAHALETGHWQGDLVLQRKDGTRLALLASISALHDTEGATSGLVGVASDVSRRKRVAEELARTAEVSEALTRVSRELIGTMGSPEFLHRLCCVTAEVLGCELAHTLMVRAEDGAFVPIASEDDGPERREVLRQICVPREMIAEVLAGLEADDVVTVGAVPDAFAAHVPETSTFESLVLALRRGAEIIGLQTAHRQRTGQPLSETQLRIGRGIAQLASLALDHARVVEELERANRVKSDFVATMSHELRTPLHVILGYADLLLMGEFGAMTEAQAGTVERLLRRAQELHELIASTLDVSRLDSGRAALHLEDVALPELLAEVGAEVQSQRRPATPETPRLSIDAAADLPRLRTDRTKLKVVLKNLVDNALKFTERGTVRVAAGALPDGLEISVADTGIGISQEVLPRLFEAFAQGDPSPSRRHAGVGLGLYIVRRLLEMLGGTIEVHSAPGQGSTFTVQLPANAARPAAPRSGDRHSADASR